MFFPLMYLDKFLIFLQKNISIFSPDSLCGWDIGAHGFQSGNDLVSSFFICLFTDRIEFSHDLMEIDNRDLCSVNKPECPPTNCRRVRINSGNSSYYLKNGHNAPPNKPPGGVDSFEKPCTFEQAPSLY